MTASRFASIVLLVLLLFLHGQLWLGRGNVTQVSALRQQLAEQTLANEQAQAINTQLASEVRDLQEGHDMVEEMARYELGMVKPNEIFVQIAKAPSKPR